MSDSPRAARPEVFSPILASLSPNGERRIVTRALFQSNLGALDGKCKTAAAPSGELSTGSKGRALTTGAKERYRLENDDRGCRTAPSPQPRTHPPAPANHAQ